MPLVGDEGSFMGGEGGTGGAGEGGTGGAGEGVVLLGAGVGVGDTRGGEGSTAGHS